MEKLISWLFLFLYIFIAYRFFINSARTLIKYYKDERRRYEIIPGTIVDFEQRFTRRNGHRHPVFYPVFEYRWKGKTRRKLARRVPAKLGPGLTPVPATKMNIGDAVDVRIFPKKPSDARIEETHYFWKSRIWVHILTIPVSGSMLLFGLYTAINQLFSNN